jgi:hypothetical protein
MKELAVMDVDVNVFLVLDINVLFAKTSIIVKSA